MRQSTSGVTLTLTTTIIITLLPTTAHLGVAEAALAVAGVDVAGAGDAEQTEGMGLLLASLPLITL